MLIKVEKKNPQNSDSSFEQRDSYFVCCYKKSSIDLFECSFPFSLARSPTSPPPPLPPLPRSYEWIDAEGGSVGGFFRHS